MAAIITRRILTILFAAVLNVLLSRFSEAKKIKWPTVSCRQESNTRHNVHFSTKNFFTDFIDKFKSNKLKLPNQISSRSLLFKFGVWRRSSLEGAGGEPVNSTGYSEFG